MTKAAQLHGRGPLNGINTDSRHYCALDVWSHVDPRFGGVGPAAALLAQAVQNDRWNSHLLAICSATESERHGDIPEAVQIVMDHGPRPLSDWCLASPLESAISNADVCHVHGIWLPHALAAVRVARRLGKPIVSSVHGMLEKWDLANRRLKKSIYSTLFQRPSLAKSACMRALSEQEASDLRAYGLKNPIVIVPNGVNPLSRVDSTELLDGFPQLKQKRIVLYLSRIHRKKGILDLLRAWPAVVRRHADAHLLIAGSDYENTAEVAKAIVSDFGMTDTVTFCGVLNGMTKFQALSAATLFSLPSYSEGMSIAVLEALSIGLPVVVTRACNVDGIAESGAGFITSPDESSLSDSLHQGLSMPTREWQSMSNSAQYLAQSRYNWSAIGETMRSVYEWLLGGDRPGCVAQ